MKKVDFRRQSLELYAKRLKEEESLKETTIRFFTALYCHNLIQRLNYNIENCLVTEATYNYYYLLDYEEATDERDLKTLIEKTGFNPKTVGRYWIKAYRDEICERVIKKLRSEGYGAKAYTLFNEYDCITINLYPPKQTKLQKLKNKLFGGRN